MMEHKWYDTVLDKLGLMTTKRHESLLEEMSREYTETMRTFKAFMESSDEKLIEENEAAALRIESYKNNLAAVNSWIDTYRQELFNLMTKCWDTEDAALIAYCDQLESKYFDYDFVPEEEEDAGEVRSETAPEDSGAVAEDP